MMRDIIHFLVLLSVFASSLVEAEPRAGSCVDYQFAGAAAAVDAAIDTSMAIRTLRHAVPVYAAQDSSAIVAYLAFDTDVKPISHTAERLEVVDAYLDTPMGWIERHDLLCQIESPLKFKGAARKVFARTQKSRKVPTYSSPYRKLCPSQFCKSNTQLSDDFQVYFVFAIDKQQKRYLLAEDYVLLTGRRFPLIGWVDANAVIQWNTHFTLKPKRDNKDENAEIKPISIFSSVTSSKQNNLKRRLQLPAGTLWYTFPFTMPLIGIVDEHYHVVLSKQIICQLNSQYCTTKTRYQVNDFYIPIQAQPMQIEIVLTETDIDNWLKLVSVLKRFGYALTEPAHSQQFVAALHEEVLGMLSYPLLTLDDSRTLRQILEQSKVSLPFNVNSPLLQYTFNELQHLTECESKRLIAWIRTIHQLLTQVISHTAQQISYQLVPYPATEYCPNITQKSQNIKKMLFKQQKPLGKDEHYRYAHKLNAITLYSLPMDFLP